jgi:hypothetical protein
MANENLKALALVRGAIDNDARIQIAAGKNAYLRYRPYVDAYAKANTEQRETLWGIAAEVLNAARDKVVAFRKGKHDPNYNDVDKVSNVRMAEFRRIMAFGAYDCHRTVLNYFADDMLTFDDMLAVAKFCTTAKPAKGKRNGEALPVNVKAPSKLQCMNAIKQRRKDKRGEAGDNGPRKRDAAKAIDAVKPVTKGLMLWFNDYKASKPKAAKLVETIMRATAELQSLAMLAKAA